MRTLATIRTHLLALSMLAAAWPAWSQSGSAPEAAKAEAAKSDAKPDAKPDSEAAAAMERAQRLANNPLRMIIEASRVRRESAPEPADAATARRAATRGDGTAVRAAGAADNAAAGDTAPPPAPPQTLITMGTDAKLARPVARHSPALKSDAAPQDLLPMGATPGPLPSPEMAALLVQPKLVAMTPPEFSQRMLDQVSRIGEITAELTIRADGSVAEVSVLPPTPRTLHRSVIDALLQWRYEPLPAERRHRVELVFSRDS